MSLTTSCTSCGATIPESLQSDALCVACRYDAPEKSAAIESDPAAVDPDDLPTGQTEDDQDWLCCRMMEAGLSFGDAVQVSEDFYARRTESARAHVQKIGLEFMRNLGAMLKDSELDKTLAGRAFRVALTANPDATLEAHAGDFSMTKQAFNYHVGKWRQRLKNFYACSR